MNVIGLELRKETLLQKGHISWPVMQTAKLFDDGIIINNPIVM